MNTGMHNHEFVDPGDDEDEEENEGGELTLIFTAEGNAVLEEDGEEVWFSDDDDTFMEAHGDAFMDAETDSKTVLNFLVEHELIDEDEIADVEVEQEGPEKETAIED